MQASILSEIVISPVKDNVFILENDLTFCVNGEFFTIKKGFNTDLASIPHIFWSFISPCDVPLVAPAIIHDWLYSGKTNLSRLECDLVFYILLQKNKVSWFWLHVIYLAVRMFGWKYFKGKTDESSGLDQGM